MFVVCVCLSLYSTARPCVAQLKVFRCVFFFSFSCFLFFSGWVDRGWGSTR